MSTAPLVPGTARVSTLETAKMEPPARAAVVVSAIALGLHIAVAAWAEFDPAFTPWATVGALAVGAAGAAASHTVATQRARTGVAFALILTIGGAVFTAVVLFRDVMPFLAACGRSVEREDRPLVCQASTLPVTLAFGLALLTFGAGLGLVFVMLWYAYVVANAIAQRAGKKTDARTSAPAPPSTRRAGQPQAVDPFRSVIRRHDVVPES